MGFQREGLGDLGAIAKDLEEELRACDADPERNDDGDGRLRFWHPNVEVRDGLIFVRYKRMAGQHSINPAAAQRYIQWLRDGHSGTFSECVRATSPRSSR